MLALPAAALLGDSPLLPVAVIMLVVDFPLAITAADMVTVHSFSGHIQTYNFLRKDIDYNTHVTLTENDCLNSTIHAKFAQATNHIGNLSVKNLSDYDQYGNREHAPKWPFKMRLVPTDPCKSPDEWHGTYL